MVCVIDGMSDSAYSLDDLSRQSVAVANITEGTSLVLLRLIEQTVENLGSICKAVKSLIEMNRLTASLVEGRTPVPNSFLDPKDEVISTLGQAVEGLEGELPRLIRKKSAIDRDLTLKPDHREYLHGAYDETISGIGELLDAVNDLRAAVIKHDLAAEPRDRPTFKSASALLSSLR